MSSRRHRLVFALWLAALYAGWVSTWRLHQLLRVSGPPELQDLSLDTAFWFFAKIVVWLVPVGWVLLREVRPRSPMAWLGFRRPLDVPLAVIAASAWLFVQMAKDFAVSTLPFVAPFDAALFNALIVAPLLEETVFRGFALGYLIEGGTRPVAAVGVTSAAWALLHVPGWLFQHVGFGAVGVEFVGVAAFGVVLGVLRLRSRSLFVPIFVHFINNVWHQGLLVRVVDLAMK